MQEEITSTERQQLREELLKDLDDIASEVGKKSAMAASVVDLIKEWVFPNIFSLADEVRLRLEALEEAQLRYRGVHDKSAQYNPGDMVTCKGGLWYAETATRGVPGAPNSGFKLMHKTPVARGGKQ